MLTTLPALTSAIEQITPTTQQAPLTFAQASEGFAQARLQKQIQTGDYRSHHGYHFTPYWYHSTQVSNWLDKVRNDNVWVHVGSRQAAIDRASRVTTQGYRVTQPADLHRLKVHTGALRIHPHIIQDIGDDWAENLDSSGYNALMYANDYEDSGSISLLVSPHVLSIERTQLLLPSTNAQYKVA